MSGTIVREFEELTIVIENRNTIWALPKRSMPNVIFHRWYGPLGTFENWRRFRERMRANKNLTLMDCYRLANRWQVQMQGTTRRPEILKHATLGGINATKGTSRLQETERAERAPRQSAND